MQGKSAGLPDNISIIENLKSKEEGGEYVDMVINPLPEETTCVLKSFIKSIVTKNPNKVKDILGEKQALSNLIHPGIIKNEGSFQDAQKIYLLLELAEGVSVSKLLSVYKKIPQSISKILFIQVVQIIEYIHSSGYIYRDLKASHVFLDAKMEVKLIDFGFCKKIDANRTKSVCGTYHMMAPEILNILLNSQTEESPSGTELTYSYEVDLYALGILLFEMLTGTPPHGYLHPTQATQEKYEYAKSVLLDVNKNDGVLSIAKEVELGIEHEIADLIRGLTNPNPQKRLSFQDIKIHPYFKGATNWNQEEWLAKVAFKIPPASPEFDEFIDFIEMTGLTKTVESKVIADDDPFKDF